MTHNLGELILTLSAISFSVSLIWLLIMWGALLTTGYVLGGVIAFKVSLLVMGVLLLYFLMNFDDEDCGIKNRQKKRKVYKSLNK